MDMKSVISNDFVELYCSAFPVCERRNWLSVEDVSNFANAHPAFNIRVLKDCENSFAGFLTWWQLLDVNYIEHFAISDSMRGKGLGTKALTDFMKETGNEVLLEVERPEAGEQAQHRIGFYQRLGFVAHPEIDYNQPPYSPENISTPLLLMTHGNVQIPNVDCDLLQILRKEVYGVSI